MIAVKPNNLDMIMEVIVDGKVTKEDMQKFEEEFNEKRKKTDKLNLLISVHKIEGYSLSTMLEDLKFSANHWKEFHKIGIIADEKWIELSAKISDFVPGVQVKQFDFDERNKAMNWLD